MTKLCYKIVSQITGTDNEFVSPYCSVAKLRYDVGHVTKPDFGSIFVFKNLKHALRYGESDLCDKWINHHVMICECDELVQMSYIPGLTNSRTELELYWRLLDKQELGNPCHMMHINEQLPIYVCNWVKPIRKLEIEEIRDDFDLVVSVDGYQVIVHE